MATVDYAAIRGEIQKTLDSHGQAVMSGDPMAAAAVFADDIRWMVSDIADVHGLAAAREFIAAAFAKSGPPRDVSYTIDELYVFEDIAVALGAVKFGVEVLGQSRVQAHQRYVLMWRRQPDGNWKIFRNMMNNGAPA